MTQINFTENDWIRIERDYTAWWNGELPRPLVYLAATDPVEKLKPFDYHSNYSLDLPVSDVVDAYEPFLAAKHYYGDAYPRLWPNFGPGIIAGFLGAQVNSVIEPAETVWFNAPGQTLIAERFFMFDDKNVWWKRVKDLTNEMVQRFAGLVQISHTDMGCNLDILAPFQTSEQLLIDLIDQPEDVKRLIGQITTLWIRFYDELAEIIRPTCRGTSPWAQIWSPGKTYMLQCDFAYMISPKMFERFVIPDLISSCEKLDHGFYHLDGKGQIGHLDLLLSLPRLRGIQWIPGDGQPSPDNWLPLLKRIRDGGRLCQVFVTREGALNIIRHLGGKGFMFVINHNEIDFRNPDVAQAFVDLLVKESCGK